MSFNTEAAIVKDVIAPLGKRYISLRHCVEAYAPFGSARTWALLQERFGVKEGQENRPEALVAATDFLEEDRTAWLTFRDALSAFVRSRVYRGLPKPRIEVQH